MKTEHKFIVIVALLTVLIIAVGVWITGRQSAQEAARGSIPMMGEKIPDMGGQHVARGQAHESYNSNPPTSGPHWEGTAGPGIKDSPVPDELILHSMEHGAAVVWYKEGLDKTDVAKIKEAFDAASGKKIMLPRKDLDVPVALTSWGYLLKLNTIDENAIKQFILINNDRAPEKEPI